MNCTVSSFALQFNVECLSISTYRIEDRGVYMCQVNTDPMIWQTAVLDVRVPPDVDVKRSSPDVEVKAGANAKLECYAHGVPPPTVSWQREDKKPIRAKDPITGLIHTCKQNSVRNRNMDMQEVRVQEVRQVRMSR